MGFYDVPNRSGPLVGSSLALLAIAVITIVLRVYTRIFMIKNFGPDDWLMLAATVRPAHSGDLAPELLGVPTEKPWLTLRYRPPSFSSYHVP